MQCHNIIIFHCMHALEHTRNYLLFTGVRSNGGLKSEAIAGIVVALAFLLILCIIVSILGLILSGTIMRLII